MKTWVVAAAAAAAILASPAAARGNAADGLQAMRELNAIVLGDLRTNQHIQGKAFVGGKAEGQVTVAQGGSQGYQASARPHLTIGGTTNGFVVENRLGGPLVAQVGGDASGMILNGTGSVSVGGTAHVGGFNPSATRRVYYGMGVSGGQAQDAPYLTRDAALAAPGTGLAATIAMQTARLAEDLGALSSHLAGLGSIGTITSTATALDYSRAANGYAVFTMTAAAFQDQNADFDRLFTALPNGMTTIVNVLGTSLVQGGNINSTALNRSVIWNFADATSIATKGWHGSILAPLATLTNGSAIEGSVAVKTFNMNGQVHLGTFAGTSSIVTSAVPEPSSWMLMLAGFGLAGYALRRRAARPATA